MNASEAVDALARACGDLGTPACVGLDPQLEMLPGEVRARHHQPLGALGEFSHGVVDAIRGVVPAIKVQSACFERYGSKGVALLEDVLAHARSGGLFVILDAKRGDIGISSAHYAEGARRAGAHAITVSGYLGASGVVPFLEAGLMVFVLVRTSNPDSDAVQSPQLADGRSVAELLADEVASLGRGWMGGCGLSAAGAVVGATKPGDASALRARLAHQVLLVPGYGAQGGTLSDVRALARPGRSGARDAGLLVTASRSVIYPKGSPGPWAGAIRGASESLAREVASLA